MSAYGAIKAPTRTSDPLPSTIWSTKALPSQSNYITLHHLTLSTALTHLGLIDYLWREFAEEVERGLTYPQEMLQGEVFTKEMFEAYFFAGDAFVGIVGSGKVEEGLEGGVREVEGGVDKAAAGRKWEDCVAGFYYVKPNYPGRSSHICNAGFVVPSTQRGSGFGRLLAKSYVHYAPKLGYQASVFNLVYVNNIASVKLWENLNFTKAGRIPRAGRLRTKDGKGEEYVDAWVFYKSFIDGNTTTNASTS